MAPSLEVIQENVTRHEGQIQDLFLRDEEQTAQKNSLEVKLEKRFSETKLAIHAVSSRVTTIVTVASVLWGLLVVAARFL